MVDVSADPNVNEVEHQVSFVSQHTPSLRFPSRVSGLFVFGWHLVVKDVLYLLVLE